MNEKHFIDWECYTFGYGYGSGEPHTLKALKDFLDLTTDDHSYDYKVISNKIGGQVFWLLLNILAHSYIVEYGTSPRFGWLTSKGKTLKDFVKNKSVQDLYELTMVEENFIHCYPDYCNCEKNCENPMWGYK